MFSGPVIVELLEDGIHARVVLAFGFTTAAGENYTVPMDFVTDGISLPRWAFTALGMTPFTTRARWAAILHDWLYNRLGMLKATADLVLHEACIAAGLPRWQADVVYAGVHIGGESSFTADQAIAAAHEGALSPAT